MRSSEFAMYVLNSCMSLLKNLYLQGEQKTLGPNFYYFINTQLNKNNKKGYRMVVKAPKNP